MLNKGDLVVIKDISDPYYIGEDLIKIKQCMVGQILEIKQVDTGFYEDAENGPWPYLCMIDHERSQAIRDELGVLFYDLYLKESELELVYTV